MKRPRPRMKRLILLLLAYAVGGAIINVAVAWACAAVSFEIVKESCVLNAMFVELRAQGSGRCGFSPNAEPDTVRHYLSRLGGLGWRVSSELCDAARSHRIEFGWPLLCQGCPGQPDKWLNSTQTSRDASAFSFLTTEEVILLPGFAINTIFYAAILWLHFAAPGLVRRRIRARRGQCPACAYPVGASNVCTECGAVLPLPQGEGRGEGEARDSKDAQRS